MSYKQYKPKSKNENAFKKYLMSTITPFCKRKVVEKNAMPNFPKDIFHLLYQSKTAPGIP